VKWNGGADSFDVARFAVFIKACGGNAAEKTVVVVHVIDKDAMAAIFEVIADAGCGDVKEASGFGRED
jgi:hypothetical protein